MTVLKSFLLTSFSLEGGRRSKKEKKKRVFYIKINDLEGASPARTPKIPLAEPEPDANPFGPSAQARLFREINFQKTVCSDLLSESAIRATPAHYKDRVRAQEKMSCVA